MGKKKLLFITEGEIDEPKFIDKVFEKCYPNVEYSYYSYSTTIHTLAKLIFNSENVIDEYLDIKSVLKENEKIEHNRDVLSKVYSDIILVFDFDPHCDNPEFEKIAQMLEYFNDSTNNGKLYINYPMMQSYKHICRYPEEDEGFKDRKIEVNKCSKYKEIVGLESCKKDIGKYNYPILMKLIGYQLKKANYLLNKKYEIPEVDIFYEIDLNKIYSKQCEYNKENKIIFVLNTFVFHIIEYNPKIMISNIKNFD